MKINRMTEYSVKRFIYLENSFSLIVSSLNFIVLMMLPVSEAQALESLVDQELSSVSAKGIAFGALDFDFRMAPTSYIEFTGSEPSSVAAGLGWERGDVRVYGLSLTGGGAANAAFQWIGGCSNTRNLCPLSSDATGTALAPVNNPYLFRAFENPGFTPSGRLLADVTDGLGTPDGAKPTNIELIAPTRQSDWRWSFWGELLINEANINGNGRHWLQSQTVINGRNTTTDRVGHPYPVRSTTLRSFQTQDAEQTLGFSFDFALSGDFRYSVRQSSDSTDIRKVVPRFEGGEGLYIKNISLFIPLGQLHYQPLTFKGLGDGNFVIELATIPNIANVFRHFYCGASKDVFCEKDSRGRVSNPNPETHGYIQLGSWNFSGGGSINPYSNTPGDTGNVPPTGISERNGVFFAYNNVSDVTNLGIARAEGLLIHGMKIKTLGLQ